MRRLILAVAAFTVLTSAFYATKPVTAQDEGKNCDLIASICRTLSNNLYDLCMATRADTGKTASDCTWEAANYTIDCMTRNGCPLIN